MAAENQNEPVALNDKPMSAWEAAAAMGIEMRLLEYTLSPTLDERLRFHDSSSDFF